MGRLPRTVSGLAAGDVSRFLRSPCWAAVPRQRGTTRVRRVGCARKPEHKSFAYFFTTAGISRPACYPWPTVSRPANADKEEVPGGFESRKVEDDSRLMDGRSRSRTCVLAYRRDLRPGLRHPTSRVRGDERLVVGQPPAAVLRSRPVTKPSPTTTIRASSAPALVRGAHPLRAVVLLQRRWADPMPAEASVSDCSSTAVDRSLVAGSGASVTPSWGRTRHVSHDAENKRRAAATFPETFAKLPHVQPFVSASSDVSSTWN